MSGAVILVLCIYFCPTLVAAARSHNVIGVFLINLLFGWSVIGWFIAFVMACGAKHTVRVLRVR